MDEIAQGGADEVGSSLAEHPPHRGALIGDRAVGREHRDEIRGVVHQRAELGSLLSAGPAHEQPQGDLDPDRRLRDASVCWVISWTASLETLDSWALSTRSRVTSSS